jgi:hypothetical protein
VLFADCINEGQDRGLLCIGEETSVYVKGRDLRITYII